MGECLIKRTGSSVDASGATATAKDVLAGKTFLLQDGDTTGVGTMVEQGSPSKDMPINGNITLPEGHYSGGKVTQNIPTFPGQTVNTGKNSVTVNTANKYASGNIQLTQIKNLTPAVIKKGMYVAGVGPGTWEGFINDDPDCPFYRGTYGPGWSATGPLSIQMSGRVYDMGDFDVTKSEIELYAPLSYSSARTGVGIVFSKEIDWSQYRKLSILADYYDGTGTTLERYTNMFIVSGTYQNMAGPIGYNGGAGIGDLIFRLYFDSPNVNKETEYDVSSYTSKGYLYILLYGWMSNEGEFRSGSYINISSIKLIK